MSRRLRKCPRPNDIDFVVDAAAPSDPARLAAEIMLGKALDTVGLTFERATRVGSFVAVVAGHVHEWAPIFRAHWSERTKAKLEPCDLTDGQVHEGWTWIAWSPVAPPSKSDANSMRDNLATATLDERHCVCFVPDEDWLPLELRLVIDHRLMVEPLTPDDVTAIAVRLFDHQPVERLTVEKAVALTPQILRLARRVEQSANDYIVLLSKLTAAAAPVEEPAVATNGSMRDAPTLSKLHGMDAAVHWGMQLAADLELFRTGSLPWGGVDRGCLLSGPPGVGKTIFARALAETCKLVFHSGSYGEWLGTGTAHQGDLLKSMRATFRQACIAAPSLIFIDEVDSFPNRATVKHHRAEWDIQVVNALLAEIDGTQDRQGVILLAACNHPHRLDPALTRSGRLDRHIHVGLPDMGALSAILAEHLDGELAGVDLSGVALAAAGSTGADCERYVRGARRRARGANRSLVVQDLLDELRGEESSEGDRRLAAIHEAGHAVAICLLRPGAVSMVSLRGSVEAGGRMAVRRSAEFPVAADISVDIAVSLAGRAAEEEVIGVPSAGAGGRENSDLALATHLALISVTALGLQPGSGLLWRGMPERHEIGAFLGENPRMAREVAAIVDGTYARVRQILREHIGALEALATTLLDRGVLDGPEVESIVRRHTPTKTDGAESGR